MIMLEISYSSVASKCINLIYWCKEKI